jgi:lysophospholipase L1-like esterase
MLGWMILLIGVVVGWLAIRLQPVFGHPHMVRLARFHPSLSADAKKVVVCMGDSLTEGNVSFDYVARLGGRLEPSGYTVLNAGVNGELAWNLLARVDAVTRIDPAYVVLLIGTNDACGIESEAASAQYVKEQKLPEPPSEQFWLDHYTRLLDVLREETRAHVILVTLPMLGEHEGQAVEEVVRRINEQIAQQAEARGLPCLALYDRLVSMLSPEDREAAPAYDAAASRRLAVRSVLQHYLLGWRWDRVAEKHGMKLLTDMIHLNERSGSALVDLIEAEIRDHQDSEAVHSD